MFPETTDFSRCVVHQALYYDTFQEVAGTYELAYEDNYEMPFIKAFNLSKQLKHNRGQEWFKQIMQQEIAEATASA